MLSSLAPSLSVVSVKPYGPRDDEREDLADEGGASQTPLQTPTQTQPPTPAPTQGNAAPTPTTAVAVKVPAPSPSPSPMLERFPAAPPRYHWTGDLEPDDRSAGRYPAGPDDEPISPPPATPAPAAPAAATPAPVAAAPTPAPAPQAPATAAPPAPRAYEGEPSVSSAWLQSREAALTALRTDLDAQRAAALAAPGVAGWIPAPVIQGESSQYIDSGGAPTATVGTGVLMFDEATFRASYTVRLASRNPAALQTLADLYGRPDARSLDAGLRAQLVDLAAAPHAIDAGPAPSGLAMGDAAQLGMLDLYLADPQIRELIARDGGRAAPPAGGIAREQQNLYGRERYDQLTRLSNATGHVREQFTQALARAQASGQGPGWVDRTIAVPAQSFLDEYNQRIEQPAHTLVEHTFDPDAFTAWYGAQPDAAHQLFATLYGASHTSVTREPIGDSGSSWQTHTTLTFDNPNWGIEDGVMRPQGPLATINLEDPPRLHDTRQVVFDLASGWTTPQTNIDQGRDWLTTAVGVIFVAAVGYVSAGTLGPEAAAAMGLTETGGAAAGVGVMGANYAGGLTLAGTMVSAGVVGAAGSLASGLVNDNLTLRGIVQGALAGALSAGLMNGLNAAVDLNTVGTLAARTTIQGGIQALLGGSFRDGAVTGLASGLADLTTSAMGQHIDDALRAGTMSASDAAAARTFMRMAGSAIRAAANPNDPTYAFASDFLGQLVNQGLENNAGPPPTPTGTAAPAFDDEGNLMPGVVDPATSYEQQQAALQARLAQQGLPPGQAATTAQQHYAAAIVVRDEAAREQEQFTLNDEALDAVAAVEPGSTDDIVLAEGPGGSVSDAGSGAGDPARRILLARRLGQLTEVDSTYMVERNRIFVRAQIDRYVQLEDHAAASGDTLLLQNLRGERQLFELTLERLDTRLIEVDYTNAAMQYAGRLAERGGGGFSGQEIVQAMQRFVAGASTTSPVDEYVRRNMYGDDIKLYLTIMGGGSIAALVGQDGTGAGSPGIRPVPRSTQPRVPNGSAEIPGTGYRFGFDEQGRVGTASTDNLQAGAGQRNPGAQRNAGGADRLQNDDGGHIFGNRFNPPADEFNLFAQNSNFNRGAYRTLENTWAEALARGQRVEVSWQFSYSGSSLRPDRLLVTYRIDGGLPIARPFNNSPGGR